MFGIVTVKSCFGKLKIVRKTVLVLNPSDLSKRYHKEEPNFILKACWAVVFIFLFNV